MTDFTRSTGRTWVLATTIALVLHGVAGVGLATMTMLELDPPKITPPIEIQMIVMNNEESPEPSAPEPTPQVTPIAPPKAPPPKQMMTPPKPVPPPKPKPTKLEPKSNPEPKPVPKPEPRVDQAEILAQQQRQAAFEAQQRENQQRKEREDAERRAREQAEADRKAREQVEADRRAKVEADRKARADADARAKAEADAKARTKAEADAKAQADADARAKAEANKPLTGQNLGTVTNASWRSRPNFSGIVVEGGASFTVTFSVDAKGNISNISGINSGDREADRKIRSAIARAKLHPFKNANGQVMSGTASFPIRIE